MSRVEGDRPELEAAQEGLEAVSVIYPSAAGLRSAYNRELQHKRFYAPTPLEVNLRDRVVLKLGVASAKSHNARPNLLESIGVVAEVVHADSTGVGFELMDQPLLPEPLRTQTEEREEVPRIVFGEARRAAGKSKLAEMTLQEKLGVALRADLATRRKLARDSRKAIHAQLLRNPSITPDEVLAMSRSHFTGKEAIQAIANNPDWTDVYEIRLALVRHPHTRLTIAQRFLGTLQKHDIKMFANSANVRAQIRQQAERMIGKRK